MGVFDYITKPFGLLMRALYQLTGNYMIAILLFSLICEILLIPLAIRQQKNQIKQASLAPRTAAIRKKYAGREDAATKQKMQNEIMDMYQAEKFNPASGCGTLLIQFPIIILLYNVIRKPLTFISRLTSADLLGLAQHFGQTATSANAVDEISLAGQIRDQISALVTQYPSLNGALIPQTKVGPFDLSKIPSITFRPFDWLMLIPLISFVVMVLSQKIMKRYTYQDPTMAEQQNNISMKIMEWTMPLFSVYIEFRFAAAIGVYWIFRTILQTVEKIIIAKVYPLPQYTEEDYKEAERQAALSNKQKKREARESDPNRKPVRSLHHIDDEEYLARHPEQKTSSEEDTENGGEKSEKTEKPDGKNGKNAPAPLKDDYTEKK
jgi:YidC/Oxa1 family membrane protein insertase